MPSSGFYNQNISSRFGNNTSYLNFNRNPRSIMQYNASMNNLAVKESMTGPPVYEQPNNLKIIDDDIAGNRMSGISANRNLASGIPSDISKEETLAEIPTEISEVTEAAETAKAVTTGVEAAEAGASIGTGGILGGIMIAQQAGNAVTSALDSKAMAQTASASSFASNFHYAGHNTDTQQMNTNNAIYQNMGHTGASIGAFLGGPLGALAGWAVGTSSGAALQSLPSSTAVQQENTSI